MRNIILLTGPAGSGKSAVARWMQTHGYTVLRFADPLKEMLRAFGLGQNHTDGEWKEIPCDRLCGKTPRHAMQTLGTEWGRNLIGPDIWTRAWQRRVSTALGNIVVDDCRFPNEVEAAREIGNTTVVRLNRVGAGIPGSHVSEQPLPCDFEVDNNRLVTVTVKEILRKAGHNDQRS